MHKNNIWFIIEIIKINFFCYKRALQLDYKCDWMQYITRSVKRMNNRNGEIN